MKIKDVDEKKRQKTNPAQDERPLRFSPRAARTAIKPPRRAPAPTIERVATACLPTEYGDFRIIGYRSLTSDEEFVALARGELRADRPTLARIHSQCLTGDVFGSVKCDCGRQLHAALRLIAEAPAPEGCGVIVYQQQEGCGIGIINKIRAYALQDAGADTIEANELLGLGVDLRTYEQCAEILLDIEPHESFSGYLKTKKERMGHLIYA